MNIVTKYGPVVAGTLAAVYLLRSVFMLSNSGGNSTGY